MGKGKSDGLGLTETGLSSKALSGIVSGVLKPKGGKEDPRRPDTVKPQYSISDLPYGFRPGSER
jgi:hypothetical protein